MYHKQRFKPMLIVNGGNSSVSLNTDENEVTSSYSAREIEEAKHEHVVEQDLGHPCRPNNLLYGSYLHLRLFLLHAPFSDLLNLHVSRRLLV